MAVDSANMADGFVDHIQRKLSKRLIKFENVDDFMTILWALKYFGTIARKLCTCKIGGFLQQCVCNFIFLNLAVVF